MEYNKLTPEEERVILYKGTERPFTGEYNNNKKAAPMFAGDVMLPYIVLRINLIRIADGQASMMKYQAQ